MQDRKRVDGKDGQSASEVQRKRQIVRRDETFHQEVSLGVRRPEDVVE